MAQINFLFIQEMLNDKRPSLITWMPKIPYLETSFTFLKTSMSVEQIPLQKMLFSERGMQLLKA